MVGYGDLSTKCPKSCQFSFSSEPSIRVPRQHPRLLRSGSLHSQVNTGEVDGDGGIGSRQTVILVDQDPLLFRFFLFFNDALLLALKLRGLLLRIFRHYYNLKIITAKHQVLN